MECFAALVGTAKGLGWLSATTLAYTTQTTTNSLKDAETAPLTVSAAPSTWVGQAQLFRENNKVSSIVRMYPDAKKKAPETLQDIEEEMAQELVLTRHHLQFKTGHQLNELRERRAAQRKAEDNFERVRKLVTQMEKNKQHLTDQVHDPRIG